MNDHEPVNLYFNDSGTWHSLPDWAEYFISIGRLLAASPQPESRTVTAIAVPTRAYGAAFVALGMVICDAAARDYISREAHFKKLRQLEPGTPVIIRSKKGKVLRGNMKSSRIHDERVWIGVQITNERGGSAVQYIDETRAFEVQPAHHSGKLPKEQAGDNTRFANAFVDRLLGNADPVQLGQYSKTVCTLVGRKSMLENEIRKTPLAVHVNGHRHADGVLQDVLRVNRFVTENQSHRSALVPVGAKPPSGEILSNVEMGVVFDGALGFLKWGGMWHSRHQVIVLDRTEAYFDDAISAINARFSQNGVDGETVLPDCEAPPGGEVLTFREAVK